MITKRFVFVHCYEQNSVISHVVDKVRAECKIICPTAKEPKIGNHTTLFSPFLAPLDEMRFMTIALRAQDILNGVVKSESNRAEVRGMDFFRNPGNDALILTLKLSHEYEEFVLFWREHMGRFANWTFPPLGEDFTPHICILEKEGLYKKVHPHIRRIEALVQPVSFHLPSPRVMMKIGEGRDAYWEDFDPLKGL